MRYAAIFLSCLVLCSCTYYSLVEGRAKHTVNDTYVIRTESPWNARSLGSATILSQHGQNLDSLIFFRPTADGEAPLVINTEYGKKMPIFKKGTSFIELPDLMKSSLMAAGYDDVLIQRTENALMDGNKALRVDFTMKMRAGPLLKGFSMMSIKKDTLFTVMFMAEETTYFPMVAKDAESLVASVSLLK
ncbi:hypothetical protein MTBLM1_20091 [Rhodospirillaceae bacterium LM-1]|nr:hypothetical protein MTBLM1_20091 [Rhodospirillaceae bacterium LM-1]